MAKMGLDCLGGHEEGLSDFAIGESASRHLADAAFGRGEGVDAGKCNAPRPGSRRKKLRSGLLLECASLVSVRQLETFPEWGARVVAFVAPPEGGTR